MMRVVMAGPLPPAIGGMATVINDIAHSSLACEVELALFDTGKRTPEGRPLTRAIWTRFALWRAWWRALDPAHSSVAHIHTCSGLTYFLDGSYVLLARLRGVPVVLHVHGARFDDFLDRLPPLMLGIARFIARRAARVVLLSGEWEQKLSVRLPGAHLAVIENGVAEPPPIETNKTAGKIVVLFLGNLCQRKGIWDLVACAGALPPAARLVLVGGEEDPGIAADLRKYLAREGLEDRVELTGPAVGKAKLRWLRSADIFVLPSYAEGVPISMLEAAAAGLPLIVTPVGGIPSVLSDGEHALFVQPGDHDALAGAINHLIGDPALRARLGAAAREHVLGRFGIENTARKYLGLYRELKPALFSPQTQAGGAEARD
ncbi:MAG: glycosyltransferase family 1 protein [Gallionella sp.]|nr:MAG: glycosyltransferase family 1 protein [Gallionella sp.]